jgi:hypothetical protein
MKKWQGLYNYYVNIYVTKIYNFMPLFMLSNRKDRRFVILVRRKDRRMVILVRRKDRILVILVRRKDRRMCIFVH